MGEPETTECDWATAFSLGGDERHSMQLQTRDLKVKVVRWCGGGAVVARGRRGGGAVGVKHAAFFFVFVLILTGRCA